MNRVITLALLGLGLAAFTPGQGVGNTSQLKDGKQIRVQATASPTSLDFGDQVVQTIGKELTVTITNNTDKPIEINLNVNIKQEVLVHLQRDVEQLINQNPQAFPQKPPK